MKYFIFPIIISTLFLAPRTLAASSSASASASSDSTISTQASASSDGNVAQTNSSADSSSASTSSVSTEEDVLADQPILNPPPVIKRNSSSEKIALTSTEKQAQPSSQTALTSQDIQTIADQINIMASKQDDLRSTLAGQNDKISQISSQNDKILKLFIGVFIVLGIIFLISLGHLFTRPYRR